MFDRYRIGHTNKHAVYGYRAGRPESEYKQDVFVATVIDPAFAVELVAALNAGEELRERIAEREAVRRKDMQEEFAKILAVHEREIQRLKGNLA